MVDGTLVSNKIRRQILATHRHPWPGIEITIHDDEYLVQAFNTVIGYVQRPNRASVIDNLEYKNYLVTLIQIAKIKSRRNNNLNAPRLKPTDWLFFDGVFERLKIQYRQLDIGYRQTGVTLSAANENDSKIPANIDEYNATMLREELDHELGTADRNREVCMRELKEADQVKECRRGVNEERENRVR